MKIHRSITTALVCLCLAGQAAADTASDTRKMDRFVDRLLARMTIEEKIGQLNMIPADGSAMTGPATKSATGERIVRGEVGALLNIMSPQKIAELQRIAVTQSRLGIPLLFGMDVIHGYNTVFPIPLAMAATWDMEAIERMARISAVEASAQGVNWTFSPMVDLSVDPRWGRVAEGAGEDPFLASLVAAAYVEGYQGNLTRNDEILACVKHFALYGAPEGGRDYNSVDMSRWRMYTDYFPPYRSAVEAGAGSVMSAFNDVEGIPAAANAWLLSDVLRGQWGFDGLVVSDWNAVWEMTVHGIGDLQTVSARGLRAGLDMDMGSQGLWKTLRTSLDEGKIEMADIDRACRRILVAKYRLGLFDDPYKYCDTTRIARDVFTPEHRAQARRIATESFVLLKNDDHLLPLAAEGTVAVIGPLADNKPNMLGTWTLGADLYSATTVMEGLRSLVGDRVELLHAKGSNIYFDREAEEHVTHNWGTPYKHFDRDDRSAEQLEAEALEIARRADVIVAVMGEAAELSGEGASRADLDMPDAQRALLRKLKQTGKPVVLVLFTGRPLTIAWEQENLDAILNVWFPGSEAGTAIADVLFGAAEPEGRLTMTFPRTVGQVPIRYAYKQTGRPASSDGAIQAYVTGYIDETVLPLYPFGYGLGYTDFSYGDLMLDRTQMSAGECVTASIDVTNTGRRAGSEIVQLYIHDREASCTRPVKELKAFRKIRLEPGETRRVSFAIDEEMLKFYTPDLRYVCEPGEFEAMAGPNSGSLSSAVFEFR